MAARPVSKVRDVVRRGRGMSLLTPPDTTRGRQATLVLLLLLVAIFVVLTAFVDFQTVPMSAELIPLVVGGLMLGPTGFRVLVVAVMIALIIDSTVLGWTAVRVGALVVAGIVAVIAREQVHDRERLGMSVHRGERMLHELRERLAQQGQVPDLPSPWHAEVVQQSAGGASFGGDFLVSTVTGDGRLELALVDVSGKGMDAGTRALMLSGALGGLLGAVEPSAFLSAANDYLLRQNWEEGFATAVHVTVDLSTGRYRIDDAGHLPAVHYLGGSGRWEVRQPDGTVLGLMRDAEFGSFEDELRPGDALLVYTDGVVEERGRDLSVGIDRLLGAAEREIQRGFRGGAQRVFGDVASQSADDRALVLLWRT